LLVRVAAGGRSPRPLMLNAGFGPLLTVTSEWH
jgi:hypothetical protein